MSGCMHAIVTRIRKSTKYRPASASSYTNANTHAHSLTHYAWHCFSDSLAHPRRSQSQTLWLIWRGAVPQEARLSCLGRARTDCIGRSCQSARWRRQPSAGHKRCRAPGRPVGRPAARWRLGTQRPVSARVPAQPSRLRSLPAQSSLGRPVPCLCVLVSTSALAAWEKQGEGTRGGADPETSCLGGFSSTQPNAMKATPITKQASANKRSSRPYRAARPVLRDIAFLLDFAAERGSGVSWELGRVFRQCFSTFLPFHCAVCVL